MLPFALSSAKRVSKGAFRAFFNTLLAAIAVMLSGYRRFDASDGIPTPD